MRCFIMNIIKISTSGFKNLDKITIEFNDKITALVSPNGYGKSNLLNAITMGCDFIKFDERAKHFLMRNSSFIPCNRYLNFQDFYFEIEYKTTFNNKDCIINYGYKFDWKTDKTQPRITNEWLRIKPNEKGKRYSDYIIRTTDKAFYKPSPKDRCDKEIKIEPDNLLINKLKNLDNLFYLQIVKEINNLNITAIFDVDTNAAFNLFPFKIPHRDSIEELISLDIYSTVYELKTSYPDKYEFLINAFKNVFPDLIEIDIEDVKPESIFRNLPKGEELVDKMYLMIAKEKNMTKHLKFSSLSRGTLKIFALLTAIVLADIEEYSLICFEELEDSIHPALLQKLLIILSNMIEKCKILITSHSPYLIQFLDIENIYLGVPNNKGIAQFKKLPSSKRSKIYRYIKDMGMSLGDYIFDMYINPNEQFLDLLGVDNK